MKTILLTIEKITAVYSSFNPYAIGSAIFAFLTSFFAGSFTLIIAILVVCLIDLITGVKVSKKNNGEGFRSKKAKAKLNDIKAYYLLLLVPLFIDKILMIENIWTTRAITAIIVGVEGWSIIGNYAILYPHLRALPLIKDKFASEIASKLELQKEEVEEKLNEATETKNDDTPDGNDGAKQPDR